MMRDIYLLKDLSVKTGCSTHTLKYYLKMGLLREIGKSPSTNFRFFDEYAVRRLKEIRQLKARGKTIKEIKKIFDVKT